MPGTVQIQVQGLDKLQMALANASPTITKRVGEALEQSVSVVERESASRTPIDTGILRSNRERSFRPLVGLLKYKSSYALFVHDGTKPHFPPLSAIEPWAKRHGVPAMQVARAIAKKGTKAHPFMTEGVAAAQVEIERFFQIAAEHIANDLTK